MDDSHIDSASDKVVDLRIGPQHFDLLKLIGEGGFGRVLLVRNCLNRELYAMKVISKALLRKKNNYLYMKSERDILAKTCHPFVVSLHFAFQSKSKIFLVMDFLAGAWSCLSSLMDFLFLDPLGKTSAVVFVGTPLDIRQLPDKGTVF